MAIFRSGVGSNLNTAGGYSSYQTDPIEATKKKWIDFYVSIGKATNAKLEEIEIASAKKAAKEKLETEKRIADEIFEYTATASEKFAKKFSENIGKALTSFLSKSVSALSSSLDSYIKSYVQYTGAFTTRLQGTNLTNPLTGASKILLDVSRNLATSPYLKQADMLENLNKLVESGIAYNLESRAYIATATQKIATTFNAFDSSLLRIIRLQQADSTAARLGMESLLTKFLNARFEDTSYLSTIGTGNITGQLLEAESLMGYKGASEFDYAVQKWLGSMSSLGVSSNTINMLAQGLGYLGSGNISALSGNTALQNLFVMASGGQYGRLLTGGLNAGNASQLLTNIVRFGQSIATSGNNVVRSELASLFGMTVSDLVSLTNITAEDIKEITSDLVTYEQLRKETDTQLSTMWQRTTLPEMVQNIISNVSTRVASTIATNPMALMSWQVANLLSESGLDPTIELDPLGVGASLTMSTAMKSGLMGVNSGPSMITAILSNLFSNNLLGTNLSVWGAKEVRRGTGLSSSGITSGLTTSASTYYGMVDDESLGKTFSDLQEESKTYTGENKGQSTIDTIKTILEEDIKLDIRAIREMMSDWNDNFSRTLFRPS